jgi:hypothetical protein
MVVVFEIMRNAFTVTRLVCEPLLLLFSTCTRRCATAVVILRMLCMRVVAEGAVRVC